MFTWQTHAWAAMVRKVGYCLLPALLGAGSALMLLVLASGPARQADASNLTYPGVCGATIQACIDAANPGDTILISAGDYTESLTLSKAVSLTGALSSTTILHALPNTRVLTVTGAAVDSSVAISGLTFTGGHTTTGCSGGCDPAGCPGVCGGGILIEEGAAPILRSVRLISNTAAGGGSGGGLSDTGTLYMTGSSVMSNTADNFGGGIYAQSAGLTETSAINNHADQGGGLLVVGAVTLTRAQLISNTAVHIGGAGYFLGAATLIDSDVMSNTSSQSIGGLLVSDATVTGGLFQGNIGTALYGSADVTLTGTRFVSNTNGSALYAFATATLSSVQFVGNNSLDGGGLYALHAVTVTGSSFMSNTASSYGGGMFAAEAVTMTDTQFVDNTAVDGGGGMAAQSAQITNTSFVHNSTAGIGGGGLYVSNAANVTEAQFVSNTSYDDGGGLKVIGPATLSQTTFVSNTAGSQGGGLIAFDAITLTAAQFVSNTAGASGGGVYFADLGVPTQRRLVNNLLAGNRAGGLGDDLYVDLPAGSVTILHTTFANHGLASGAALNLVTGTVGITDSIFSSHTVGISLTAGSVFQDYNLFFGNGKDVSGPVSGGAHSLTGDPLFVDPTGGDYHLSDGSLAVDNGTDAGVTTDFEGDPRPQGNGFDIGFDESPFTALADVSVAKSASAGARQPGQTLTYTLVYSNAGPNMAPSVRLTDIVPANLIVISYTSSGAALTPVGFTNYAWQVANLAPGAGGMVTITGVISNARAGTVFTNTASITTAYSDTNSANNTSVVSVTVANAAPVAADDIYTVARNATLNAPAPGVLANDSDPNNDALTATLGASPLTGTFGLNADGSFTYTPPLNFAGPVTFTYQASDGLLLSAPATVTLFVNQPPTAAAGMPQTAATGALIHLDGSSSSDPDHNLPLTYGWHQTGGTAVVLSSATISRPAFTAPGAPAVLTFTLTVSDAFGLASAPAMTTVTVDDIPLATSDAYSTTENAVLHVAAPGVLANDSDAFPGGLTAQLVTGPATGTLALAPTGAFTYTPPIGFSGLVTFTYRASDGLLFSPPAMARITVNPFKLYLPLLLR